MTYKCPICFSDQYIILLNIRCGNLDNSPLYMDTIICSCKSCGHIFNLLSRESIEGLDKYYKDEYSAINIKSCNIDSDMPGGDGENALSRYRNLYELMSDRIDKQSRILDVGCASGGFLRFLNGNGYNNLFGIEPTDNYIESAKNFCIGRISKGTAEKIDLPDSSVDIVVLDQVLEHIVSPIKAIDEAYRVLSDNGLLCVAVPDISRYSESTFFDFYWFLLREHVQHFDFEHLSMLGNMGGFRVIEKKFSSNYMMSDKISLPNLIVMFQKTSQRSKPHFSGSATKTVQKYILSENKKLIAHRKMIDQIIASGKRLFVWGVGREFLYLYEMCSLKYNTINGLIDSNEYKQKNYTVGSIRIVSPDIIHKLTSNDIVLITATAHEKDIRQYLSDSRFNGDVICA